MNSNKLPYFFLALAVILSIAAVILLFTKQDPKSTTTAPILEETSSSPDILEKSAIAETHSLSPDSQDTSSTHFPDSPSDFTKPQELDQKSENFAKGQFTLKPLTLLKKIGNSFEKNDLESLSKLIGTNNLTSEKIDELKALTKNNPLSIGEIREIGEIEINRRTRWAIELKNRPAGQNRILIDLIKDKRKWGISQLTLPEALPEATDPALAPSSQPSSAAPLTDPLSITDRFLTSILSQDFEGAVKFIDPKKISEVKIAALCILFEEGQYKLREERPLRAMFNNKDTAGFIANLTNQENAQNAQFSLNLRHSEGTTDWKLIEINLDSLLSDYAKRHGDGDVYYSPLVKNPTGGETLALYFEFDQDQMNQRTSRQLEIVAAMLKADPTRKITLSGHTDALGSENYNDNLSSSRAQTVQKFLATAGVSKDQIITLAKGASQPRRPNITETGEDNPNGRRANRRTEIYLDF